MSTMDAPGYGTAISDTLALGCWAEHKDGSLIFVASVENHRVIFEIFDLSAGRVIEYRDAMSEVDFKSKFSVSSPDKIIGPWTWHNRTAFPWDKVIAAGSPAGTRLASAQDVLDHAAEIHASRDRLLNADNKSAAEQVAADLGIQGHELLLNELQDIIRRRVNRPMRRLAREISDAISRRFGGPNPPTGGN